MRTTSLALLFALAATASAFVCPPDFCKNVKCARVTAENCNGRVSVKGGFCGCCDSCIQQLGVGEVCLDYLQASLPAKAECKPGLHCHRLMHTCVPLTLDMPSPPTVANGVSPRDQSPPKS